jgi:hypothetical protein
MKKVYNYVHKKNSRTLAGAGYFVKHTSPNPTHPLKTAKNVKEHIFEISQYISEIPQRFSETPHSDNNRGEKGPWTEIFSAIVP